MAKKSPLLWLGRMRGGHPSSARAKSAQRAAAPSVDELEAAFPEPKPGWRESMRRQAAEREAAEPQDQPTERADVKDCGADYHDLEGAVIDVRTWASVAWTIWCETPLHSRSAEDRLAFERLDRVLEQVQEAAEELHRTYYGKPDDDDQGAAESERRAARARPPAAPPLAHSPSLPRWPFPPSRWRQPRPATPNS
jgi:hypothetical protein